MQESKTRKQRRMEKRQAIIVLVLLLVVSLASFALGIMVGRRGAERDMAQHLTDNEKVLVAQDPGSMTKAVDTRTVVEPAETVVEQVDQEPKVTFYDDLSKDEIPLGSGINQAPPEKKETVAVELPLALPEKPIVVKHQAEKAVSAVKEQVAVAKKVVTPEPAPVAKPQAQQEVVTAQNTAMPASSNSGRHVVQIGSFNSAGDAVALKQKMAKKGYPVTVAEADLGAKGLWYRVRVGPYANTTDAKQMLKYLDAKEKIKGYVTKR